MDISESREGNEGKKTNQVVVTMENTNVEANAPLNESLNNSMDKSRGKNAKQLTWVLMLKAHRAVGYVAWSAASLWTLLSVIKKRLLFRQAGDGAQGDRTSKNRFLLKFIRGFLILSLVTLAFELIAYFKGWQAEKANSRIPDSWLHSTYLSWLEFRAEYIAYPIQVVSNVCVTLFVIQSVDRLVQCLGCLYIKLRKVKPAIEGDPFSSEDGSENRYPLVLVQIPMCNEREVYQQSISAVCQLDWPKDRLLIQVLDDSDDVTLQHLIEDEVSKWSQRGVNIVYRHRLDRSGYKAGNLKSAMSCDYVKNYEFVAMFDADFQPNPDFLKLTVPHFKRNPDLGLVQARWKFVNRDENLLTRLQNINFCFHFEVEQQVNGVFWNFFGFNGTAGVWRIKALEDSGGWLDRTTVEDMDIAVRAHLKGWKFIFLNDVKVLCELPESYEAYRKQQHRWHSGPMNLFRLCLPDILTSKISIWNKANVILLFFLLRKLILPFYSFILFCIILPLTMFVPEAELPVWVICYVPVLMSFINILLAPGCSPFIVPYLLFENTMSVTKFDAMLSGVLQLGSSYEWVVTKKAGRSLDAEQSSAQKKESKGLSLSKIQNAGLKDDEICELNTTESGLKEEKVRPPAKRANKIYKKELAISLLLLVAAVRSLLSGKGVHFYFLLFQGASFLFVGLDLIGVQLS